LYKFLPWKKSFEFALRPKPEKLCCTVTQLNLSLWIKEKANIVLATSYKFIMTKKV